MSSTVAAPTVPARTWNPPPKSSASMACTNEPFDAEPVGLLIKHIHEPPPHITSLPRAAGLHPALAKVVMDNLAKDPLQRAQGARAFGAALAAAAKEANISID